MLGVENFNNISSNGTPFDHHHHIFANISEPTEESIIDLSSGAETDEFETETIINNSSSNYRKRHIRSNENLNGNKRKHNDNVQLYNESQKNRNRNVPLKKRGASNREEELNFLNLIAIEDSNQAQNLKIECSTDLATTCDSSSSSSAPQKKLYHDLEPKEKSNNSSSNKNNIVNSNNKNETSSICNCFECFPSLGSSSSGSSRVKCRKLNKSLESIVYSPLDVQTANSSSSSSDLSLIPGPSGIQKHASASSIPVKKRMFCESDDEYDSDENQLPQSSLAEDVKNIDGLRAPHLQLDWLSDSSRDEDDEEEDSENPEPDDDDVIFVNDRSEPIDLTADSDNETESANSTTNKPPSTSSIDASRKSIDRRSNAEGTREVRQSSASNNIVNYSVWPPSYVINSSIMSIPENSSQRNTNTNAGAAAAQRTTTSSIPAPSSSSTVSISTPAVQQSTIPAIILPPIAPSNIQHTTRQINFREMITGNDVMLFDGGVQNFSTNSRETSSARTRNSPPPLSSNTNESRNPAVVLNTRESNQNPLNGNSSNAHHHHHHHRRHFHPSYNAASSSSYHVEDLTTTQPSNTQHSQQTSRPHSVGRCPFMTEGHHYNRPRRLAREFYPVGNNRPYAIHEDLWRRQYQEQEIRRHYWSTAAFNNETPEVQVHMVHMDPTAVPHRLSSNIGDNTNTNTNPPQNELLNSRYRMQRLHRRSW